MIKLVMVFLLIFIAVVFSSKEYFRLKNERKIQIELLKMRRNELERILKEMEKK